MSTHQPRRLRFRVSEGFSISFGGDAIECLVLLDEFVEGFAAGGMDFALFGFVCNGFAFLLFTSGVPCS